MKTKPTNIPNRVCLTTTATEKESSYSDPSSGALESRNRKVNVTANPSKSRLVLLVVIVSLLIAVSLTAALIKAFMSPEWLPYFEVAAIVIMAVAAMIKVFREKPQYEP